MLSRAKDARSRLLGASSSAAEYSSEYPRIPAAMQHSDDCDRFLIWRVGDYIITHGLKSQWPCCEVGTVVAGIGESGKRPDRVVDFFADSISGVEAVGGDVLPDFFEVCVRLRMEDKSAHE